MNKNGELEKFERRFIKKSPAKNMMKCGSKFLIPGYFGPALIIRHEFQHGVCLWSECKSLDQNTCVTVNWAALHSKC